MIRLKVAEYCHDCMSFEADVILPQKTMLSQYSATNEYYAAVVSDTIVRCKNQKKCENIARYLHSRKDKLNNE